MNLIHAAAINTVLQELKNDDLAKTVVAELITKAARENVSGITVILGAFALGVLYARKQLTPQQQEADNATRKEP